MSSVRTTIVVNPAAGQDDTVLATLNRVFYAGMMRRATREQKDRLEVLEAAVPVVLPSALPES